MFNDVLSGENLSSAARRELIRSTIDRVYAEGLSVTAAFNAYKEAGMGIRRSDFSQIYYENAPRYIQASRIAGFAWDREIDKSVIAPSYYQLKADYRYIAEIVLIDPVTDEVYTDSFGIDTNFIGTKQDIADAIYDAYKVRYSDRAAYLTDIVVERAYYTP